MSVTVVSCAYGPRFVGFVPRWAEAVDAMQPRPDKVIVAADRWVDLWIDGAELFEAECSWKHPQPFYYNLAISRAATEWVWVVDIDDYAKRDGLHGLNMVAADVWQMGFDSTDGETYVVPQWSNEDYLASERNVYVNGSAFRKEAFDAVGGYRDLALQDWDLWRRLARAGASFQSSGRTHFDYVQHDWQTHRSKKMALSNRPEQLAEMMAIHA